jgi:UDP-N-acetylmuramate--alanine ligase
MKKSVHFIGIGGIGMSGIARLLLNQGYSVSGSDIRESSITKELRAQGAKIFIGHNAKNVGDVDLVTYSSAINYQNSELLSAIERNIPVVKRAELLSELMKNKKTITVAGAHGKTTTTSMIAFILDRANFSPTVVTGGNVFNFSSTSLLGKGPYFITELDESDGSFLYFRPLYSIVTNIDYEHIDYYQSWDNILNAFSRFFDQTHKKGLIFICGDDKNLKNILKNKNKRCISFGLSKNCDIFADNILLENFGSKFRCIYKNKNLGEFKLNIPGKHNISNCLAVIALALELGIEWNKLQEYLYLYKGVERRFQFKGQVGNIKIIDDYGHHPTEIRATLETAKSLHPKRLIIAFQPHRYTRTKFLLDEFVKSFNFVDYLIITDIYSANEEPIPGITAENLYLKLKDANKKEVYFVPKQKIVDHIIEIARPGDLIMTLGAGDIGNVSNELLKRLKEIN